MFGTVARVTVQAGKEEEFLMVGEAWTRERGAATGQVAEYVFQAEGGSREYFLIAVFRDRETYYKNANDPVTDRWYQRMLATLEAEPEWNDGAVVQSIALNRRWVPPGDARAVWTAGATGRGMCASGATVSRPAL